MIPPAAKDGIDRYWHDRCPTGGFLQAVLENNLFEAFGRADLDNRLCMFHIVQYIYKNLPRAIYGSKRAVQDHLYPPEEEPNGNSG